MIFERRSNLVQHFSSAWCLAEKIFSFAPHFISHIASSQSHLIFLSSQCWVDILFASSYRKFSSLIVSIESSPIWCFHLFSYPHPLSRPDGLVLFISSRLPEIQYFLRLFVAFSVSSSHIGVTTHHVAPLSKYYTPDFGHDIFLLTYFPLVCYFNRFSSGNP